LSARERLSFYDGDRLYHKTDRSDSYLVELEEQRDREGDDIPPGLSMEFERFPRSILFTSIEDIQRIENRAEENPLSSGPIFPYVHGHSVSSGKQTGENIPELDPISHHSNEQIDEITEERAIPQKSLSEEIHRVGYRRDHLGGELCEGGEDRV